jgi:hypothetical protein
MRNLLTPAKQGRAGEKAKQSKLEEAPQYGTLRPGWLADWLGWAGLAEESKNATGGCSGGSAAQRGYVETGVRGLRCAVVCCSVELHGCSNVPMDG